MNDKLSRQNCVLYVCGIVPVVWLALLAAPLLEGGLVTLLIHDAAEVRAKEHTREQAHFIIAVRTLALFA